MIQTFFREKNNKISIFLIFSLILIFFFFLFFGNTNLDQYSTVEEIANSEEIVCNQHYWSLKNKINSVGNFDISVTHKDIYVIPEFNNLFCLGKVNNVILDGDSVYIETGTNLKVFKYLLIAIFLFYFITYYFSKNIKKQTLFLWFLTYLFVQLYLFSSIKNPLLNFYVGIFLILLSITITEILDKSKNKKSDTVLLFLLILLISLMLLKYIFLDYLILLTLIATIFLKCIQKSLKFSNYDILYLILISHIGLIIGGVDYPLSRNQLNYFPSIFHNLNAEFFSNHYLINITYPYPAFEELTLLIIKTFGLTSVNFLNYFSYFFGLLVTFVFIKILFKENWLNISLIFAILSGRLGIYSFFKDTGWDKSIYENSFLKSGIGENQLITHLFQPTTFDILVVLTIVLLIKKKYFAANIISIISIFLHTYNIVPIFFIYLSYLISNKYNKDQIISKIKNSKLLLLFLPLIYLLNVRPFADSSQNIYKADLIMTEVRIPMHRLFSGNLSIFGDSKNEFLIKLINLKGGYGFHYELEYFLASIFLFFIIKNKLIKKLNILIFIGITASLMFISVFENTPLASQIRNLVPWRMSNIIYLISIIYFLNVLLKKMKSRNLTLFISLFILLNIFLLSNYTDINENRLRAEFDGTEVFNGLNLIHPSDSHIVFGTSENWEKNTFTFLSTTHTFYAHPYKANEIVDWYQKYEEINNFFNSGPSCKEFNYFLNNINAERALFSSMYFVPESIGQCESLIKEENFGYYVFENNN